MEDLKLKQQLERQAFQLMNEKFWTRRATLSNLFDSRIRRAQHLSPSLSSQGAEAAVTAMRSEVSSCDSTSDPNNLIVTSAVPGTSTSFQALTRISTMGANLIGGLAKGAGAAIAFNHNSALDSNASEHQGQSATSVPTEDSSGHAITSPVTVTCQDCEERIGALDNTDIVPLYSYNPLEDPAGVVKQVTPLLFHAGNIDRATRWPFNQQLY